MEKYSRFGKREAHPMEKYIGRLAKCCGEELEVVGYNCHELDGIVTGKQIGRAHV